MHWFLDFAIFNQACRASTLLPHCACLHTLSMFSCASSVTWYQFHLCTLPLHNPFMNGYHFIFIPDASDRFQKFGSFHISGAASDNARNEMLLQAFLQSKNFTFDWWSRLWSTTTILLFKRASGVFVSILISQVSSTFGRYQERFQALDETYRHTFVFHAK